MATETNTRYGFAKNKEEKKRVSSKQNMKYIKKTIYEMLRVAPYMTQGKREHITIAA